MILLAFLIIIGPIVLLCLAVYGYRVRAQRAEVRANRAEGALDESRGYGEKMRDLAAQAIGVAHGKHFPACNECGKVREDNDYCTGGGLSRYCSVECKRTALERRGVDPCPDGLCRLSSCRRCHPEWFPTGNVAPTATFTPPVVAYCSRCNVSVRHEASEYPVPCPACKTLIDPVLDNPPEL